MGNVIRNILTRLKKKIDFSNTVLCYIHICNKKYLTCNKFETINSSRHCKYVL